MRGRDLFGAIFEPKQEGETRLEHRVPGQSPVPSPNGPMARTEHRRPRPTHNLLKISSIQLIEPQDSFQEKLKQDELILSRLPPVDGPQHSLELDRLTGSIEWVTFGPTVKPSSSFVILFSPQHSCETLCSKYLIVTVIVETDSVYCRRVCVSFEI